MSFMRNILGPLVAIWIALCALDAFGEMHLLGLYPTSLTNSDLSPRSARPWNLTTNDLFRISSFSLAVGEFRVESGVANLGLGRSRDGAVFAIVIPNEAARLTTASSTNAERLSHI